MTSRAVYGVGQTPEWGGRVGTLRVTPAPSYSAQQFVKIDARSRNLYQPIQIPCFPYIAPDN